MTANILPEELQERYDAIMELAGYFEKKLRRVVRNYEKGNPFRWTAFLSMAASCVRLFSAPIALNLKFQFLAAYTLKLN